MKQMISSDVRKKVIKRDGNQDILLHFMEETGEVLTKINHVRRDKCSRQELEHEIADMIVCLEFVKQILDLDEIAIEKQIRTIADDIKNETSNGV